MSISNFDWLISSHFHNTFFDERRFNTDIFQRLGKEGHQLSRKGSRRNYLQNQQRSLSPKVVHLAEKTILNIEKRKVKC